MKTLEEEAQEYVNKHLFGTSQDYKAFIAGANSKCVQAEKIKAQIDVYLSCIPFICDEEYRIEIRKRIEIGEKLLKQLENESKTN